MGLIDGPFGFKVDADAGLVIGHRGKPVGSPNTRGYLQVDARRRGLGLPFVHRIIWEAANGPIPAGYEINHKNGIKSDNRIANLEVTTRSENMRHAFRTGLKSNVGVTGRPRSLTPEQVQALRDIRSMPASPSLQWLADRLGVTRETVSRAIRDDKYLRARGHDIEVEVVD